MLLISTGCLAGLYILCFIRETFRRFRNLKGNLLLLSINSFLLILSGILIQKLFWNGIGTWGISPYVSHEKKFLYSGLFLHTMALLSIFVSTMTWLFLLIRSIRMYRRSL